MVFRSWTFCETVARPETMPESIVVEVLMTSEDQVRVQQLCILIQNETEQCKLTELMQQLLELLDGNLGRSADTERKNPSL